MLLLRHIVVVIILMVVIVIIHVLCALVKRFDVIAEDKKNQNMVQHPRLVFTTSGTTNEQTLRSSCDVETVYSMTDEHCQQVCSSYNVDDATTGNTYVSRHGVCLNTKTVQLQNDAEAKANECNPKNGVLAYVIGDTQFGTLKHYCLSIDIGVQPDDGRSTTGNTLCQNGTIDIDYTKSFPQLSNCKCNDDTEFLALIPGTSTTRARGVCINNASKNAYQLGDLIYKANRDDSNKIPV